MDHSVYDVEAYVLGSLDPEETVLLEAHLSTCAQCQHDVSSYVPVLHRMRALAPPPPPPLVLPQARRAFSLPRGFQAVAAALLIAVGALGGGMYQHAQSNDMVAVAAMAATSTKEVRLIGTHVEGRAIVGMGRRRTAFVLAGLPPVPRGSQYAVWVHGNGSTVAGMLHRMPSGYEVLVVDRDLLDGASAVAVVVEPMNAPSSDDGETVASGLI